MLKINSINSGIKVQFHYDVPENKTFESGQLTTICEILDANTLELISRGVTRCSIFDNPNKNAGRKRALRRAMRGIFDKEVRALVWKEYFSKRGKIN